MKNTILLFKIQNYNSWFIFIPQYSLNMIAGIKFSLPVSCNYQNDVLQLNESMNEDSLLLSELAELSWRNLEFWYLSSLRSRSSCMSLKCIYLLIEAFIYYFHVLVDIGLFTLSISSLVVFITCVFVGSKRFHPSYHIDKNRVGHIIA